MLPAPVEALTALIGARRGPSAWLTIEQGRVDAFAEATEDRQWIHIDVERATAGPFGGPIAHGYLSVSLIPFLAGGLLPREGFSSAINYGSNRVRFPQPLPVGTRVRGWSTLLEVAEHPLGFLLTQKVEIEAEGLTKPVCVAETLAVLVP